MIEVVHTGNNGMSSLDALTAALTSGDATTRIIARGASSNWVIEFARWVDEEMNRPKVKRADVLYAMIVLQLQLTSTIAAQATREDGDAPFLDLYLQLAKSEIPASMRRTRVAAKELRR